MTSGQPGAPGNVHFVEGRYEQAIASYSEAMLVRKNSHCIQRWNSVADVLFIGSN